MNKNPLAERCVLVGHAVNSVTERKSILRIYSWNTISNVTELCAWPTSEAPDRLFINDGEGMKEQSDERGINESLSASVNANVDSITVHWPSGAVQAINNVRADQLIQIRELSNKPTDEAAG